MRQVLEDFRTAPIPEPLRAMLGFVETLTLDPDAVGPADVAPLRAAGLTDEAIADAIHLCAQFNLINRLADTLGWDMPTSEDVLRSARMLLKMGYLPPGQ